ncbi:unnamed protein product [Closterium sp. NIES-53]
MVSSCDSDTPFPPPSPQRASLSPGSSRCLPRPSRPPAPPLWPALLPLPARLIPTPSPWPAPTPSPCPSAILPAPHPCMAGGVGGEGADGGGGTRVDGGAEGAVVGDSQGALSTCGRACILPRSCLSSHYHCHLPVSLSSRLSVKISLCPSVCVFRFRTLPERLLGIRAVYAKPHMARAVSFEYMNRQLVWNEFSASHPYVTSLPALPTTMPADPLLVSWCIFLKKLWPTDSSTRSCPKRPCAVRPCSHTVAQPCSYLHYLPPERRALLQPASRALLPCPACAALPCSPRPAALQPVHRAALPLGPRAALPCISRATMPCPAARRDAPCCPPARHALLPCALCPAAAHASRSAAPRVALYCSPCAALCCPARRALLPRASRSAALHVAPCCPAQRALLPYPPRALPCSLRRALPCPTAPPSPAEPRSPARAALPNPSRTALPRSPAPHSHPATTTAVAAARAIAGAGSGGGAAGARGAGGATRSAGGAAGAGVARGGQQQSLPLPDDPTPQQLREWVIHRARPGGGGFGFLHAAQRRQQSQQETFSPQLLSELVSQQCVAASVEAAALGASESAAALGASESAAAPGASEYAAALGASNSAAAPGASESAAALGLHLPTFSMNLVSNTAIQDVWVDTFIPGGQLVAICHVAASSQVSASGQLVAMHSRLLVSGLPRSLPSFPRLPAPPCLPCIEGRQRTAPHSSKFPPTTAPVQTLHMDVWGLARIDGTDQECYFLLVVDNYTRYTTVFPLRRTADVSGVLIPWICATRRQLRERFCPDLSVLRLHSDRGGEFSSGLLAEFCRDKGIYPLPPQGPAPSGVSHIDPPPLVEPLEISSDSSGPAEGGDPAADNTAATRRSPRLETPPDFPPQPSSPPPQPAAVAFEAQIAGAEPGGAETEGEGSGGAGSGGATTGGANSGATAA